MRNRVSLAGIFFFGLLSAEQNLAHALPEYPEALQDATGSPCVPHCNVCHRDDNAGSGTVDRPFGKSIESVGRLRGGGSAQVASAVTRLADAATDSDGDGVGDIDELAAGDDPNYSGAGDLCGPKVGCSTARATHGPAAGILWALSFTALARWLRRRKSALRG